MFNDDDEEIDEKTITLIERTLTSYAKSLGNPGAVVASLYSVLAEADEQIDKWIQKGVVAIKTIKVDMSLQQIEERANAYVGTPYGWFDLMFIWLLGILNKKWIKKLKVDKLAYSYLNKSRIICSEFVSRLLYDSSFRKINLEELFDKKYSLITPADLWQYLNFKSLEIPTIELEQYIDKL